MIADPSTMGRHELIELVRELDSALALANRLKSLAAEAVRRVRDLEAENARWVSRVKVLEERADRARAVLAGGGAP